MSAYSQATWEHLKTWFLWPTWPMFLDLSAIWSGCQSWSHGVDPLTDPNSPFNYPRIWLLLSAVDLQGMPLLPFALALEAAVLTSLVCWFPPRTWWEGLLVAALVWSPPIRFVLERGNIDLVVFLTVVIGLACDSRMSATARTAWIAPALFLISACLKLYPIFILLAGLWINRKNTVTRPWWTAAFIAACTLFTCRYQEIIDIGRKTAQTSFASYGVTVLGMRAGGRLLALIAGAGSVGTGDTGISLRWIATGVCLGVSVAAFLTGRLWRKDFAMAPADKAWFGFGAAAVVYVSTFFLGANYCYRLIFLLLGVPYLVSLSLVGCATAKAWARATLAVALLVFFAPLVSLRATFLATQLLHWSLVFLFVSGLAASAPNASALSRRHAS